MTDLSYELTRVSLIPLLNINDSSSLQSILAGTIRVIRNATNPTKEISVRFFLLVVLLIASILIASTESHAQDVYNFYFQKNQGAMAGGGVTPLTTTDMMAPNQPQAAGPMTNKVQANLVQTPVTAQTLSKWELGAYKSWIGAQSTTTSKDNFSPTSYKYKGPINVDGFSLIGAYRFNKFFTAELGAFIGTGWAGGNESHNAIDNGKSYDGSIGFAVVPIHINLFGYELIEIGINGGVMTQTEYKLTENYNDATRKYDMKLDKKSKNIVPYLGPKIAVNLTKDLGITIDGRLNPKTDGGGIASLGLRYRF